MTLQQLSKSDDILNVRDEQSSIVKSAVGFSFGTFLSRVTGLLRDMSMAFCFGTDASIAAFLVAFRFANLLRRIFGEGALLNSFVPYFESQRKLHPNQAAVFFRDIFFSLTTVLVLLVFFLDTALLALWQWGGLSPDNNQILLLTILMFPGILFICLYSICAGLLQCQKKFFLAGVAPVAFNIVWIAAVWISYDSAPQKGVIILSVSIVLAYLFQWLMTLPPTLAYLKEHFSWKECLRPKLFSPEIKLMLSSLTFGVIGVSATQINSAVDTVFARYASLEGPAYLNYAIHLEQLPLALIGIGMATALLPSLSRAIQSGDQQRYQDLLRKSVSKALFLLIPCTFGILALGQTGINLLFGRGDFDANSTYQTTFCLWGYGIGLAPMALVILLTPAFHAQKDFRTPMIASLLAIALNFLLNFLLVYVWHYGPASLAVATSAAALFNVILLLYFLKKQGVPLFKALLSQTWKPTLAALIACLLTIQLGDLYFQDPTKLMLLGKSNIIVLSTFREQFIQFSCLSAAFLASFFAFISPTLYFSKYDRVEVS